MKRSSRVFPQWIGDWKNWLSIRWRGLIRNSLGLFKPSVLRRQLRVLLRRFFVFRPPNWAYAVRNTVQPPTDVKVAHLVNPLYWIVWACGFSWSWLISRPYNSLGPAVPAIAMAAVLGVLVFEVRFQDRGTKLSAYREMLNEALIVKDYETANVALGTLTDLTPDDLSFRFQRALLEDERGQHATAVEQMLRLAVGKRYGQAALWLVTKELDIKNVGTWTPEQHQCFRLWTEIALRDRSAKSQLPAKTLMATYLYGTGAFAESIAYFDEIIPQSPDMAYAVAVICRDRGDARRTKAFAEISETYCQNQLMESPTNVQYRLNLARAMILLAKEDAAVTLLLDGYKLTNAEDLKTAAAETLVAYAVRVGRSDNSPVSLMERLRLHRQAMELSPSSELVMDSIVELLFQVRDNKNKEVLALRNALVQGLDEDSVHFIRGTVAILNNDFDDAKVHLELASKKNANLPGILNNLAVAISKSKTPDLEAALKFSNSALEQMPSHPFLRDTRGQILVKMKRYSEAIPDLEAALKAPEISESVHGALAMAYEELGQKELAADHRLFVKQSAPDLSKATTNPQ